MSTVNVNAIDKESGSTLTLGGSGTAVTLHASATASGFGLNSVQVFTSSGTWNRPTGVTKVIVEVQGAGGGGSRVDANNDRCISGAAGGYAKKFLNVSSISTSTITVGAGGAGGASAASDGAVGGNSSWADGTNTVTGAAGTTAAPDDDTLAVIPGGVASGGDINIDGAKGGPTGAYASYSGPDSFFGTGGGHVAAASYMAAGENDGMGYGSGGGGSQNARGGNGAAGIVIVWEYK